MPSNAEAYNESVPMEFTRALLVQARAYDKDVAAILEAAHFPFDPLRQDVQTMFVSREQYSRLCLELFEAIGDESGGVMSDVQTPPGTMRLIALSMVNSANLAAAMERWQWMGSASRHIRHESAAAAMSAARASACCAASLARWAV